MLDRFFTPLSPLPVFSGDFYSILTLRYMEVDSATVWTDCLDIIQKQVDEQNFNTWFKPIIPLRHEGDVLTIQVPSQFFYEWLEENYVQILKKAIHSVLGDGARLEYSVIVDSGNQRNPPLTVN